MGAIGWMVFVIVCTGQVSVDGQPEQSMEKPLDAVWPWTNMVGRLHEPSWRKEIGVDPEAAKKAMDLVEEANKKRRETFAGWRAELKKAESRQDQARAEELREAMTNSFHSNELHREAGVILSEILTPSQLDRYRQLIRQEAVRTTGWSDVLRTRTGDGIYLKPEQWQLLAKIEQQLNEEVNAAHRDAQKQIEQMLEEEQLEVFRDKFGKPAEHIRHHPSDVDRLYDATLRSGYTKEVFELLSEQAR